MEPKKRILVCPLDWGLGHATRCIPLIDELLKKNHQVFIASSGGALALLKLEFPALTFFELAAYDPKYFSVSFPLSLALQLPRFMSIIRTEHKEIENIIRANNIDAVISDNRYGCWSGAVPSIFITHQVTLRTKFFSRLINNLHYQRIRKFSAIWVPDVAGDHSLAGELAINDHLQPQYIGPLSRFKPGTASSIKYEMIAIISGPEPQRSIFEKLIRTEFKKSGKRTMMVKGIVTSSSAETTEGTHDEVNHLDAKAMNAAILESEIVISRPGYSTIMDLAAMGKRAIFVPTPGQTEQEYLGEGLMKKRIALSVAQKEFDLKKALDQSGSYSGFSAQSHKDLLAAAVNTLFP